MNPVISIITPTYNRYNMIRKCMKEVVEQDYSPIEHIVVDDGSEDETQNLSSIIHLSQRVGAARARNIAVSHCSGKYVTFIDDDDILYPHHCSVLYSAIQDCDFVYAIADKVRDNRPIGQWRLTTETANLREKNFIPICTVMLSKRVWDMVGGMDENLPFYQDWDLWLRLSKIGVYPKHVPVATSKIFYYPDTITGKRIPKDTNIIRDFILRRSEK